MNWENTNKLSAMSKPWFLELRDYPWQVNDWLCKYNPVHHISIYYEIPYSNLYWPFASTTWLKHILQSYVSSCLSKSIVCIVFLVANDEIKASHSILVLHLAEGWVGKTNEIFTKMLRPFRLCLDEGWRLETTDNVVLR